MKYMMNESARSSSRTVIPAGYKFPSRYTMSREESADMLPKELHEELDRIRIQRDAYERLHKLVRPSWAAHIEAKESFMEKAKRPQEEQQEEIPVDHDDIHTNPEEAPSKITSEQKSQEERIKALLRRHEEQSKK